MDYNEITKAVVSASFEVHKNLGPGLLESVYQKCLIQELRLKGFECRENAPVKVVYKGVELEKCFFIDVLVNEQVLIELKAVELVLPVHKAQLLSYLRLSNKKIGLLINFNVPLLKDGITRCINWISNCVIVSLCLSIPNHRGTETQRWINKI